MAKTTGGEITWNLDLDAKNFDSGIKKAQDNVSGFQKAVDKASSAIASSMSSIDKAFRNAEAGSQLFLGSLTAIIGAAAGAAGFGIKMAADIETMTQGFVTLLGSTEEANKAIAMIKKDAAQTPFELPGLINANQLLTSVTKDAGRSETLLLNIGKALTSMGKGQPELDRIIVNLQQIGAVGKASMIDIKQFAFAGIPIFDMLKKKFAETGQAVVDNSKKISENGAKIDELKDKLKIAQQQQKEFTSETKKSTVMMKKNQIENYKQQIEKLSGTVGDLTSKNGELTNS
jgi:tape measure domain-containing protein